MNDLRKREDVLGNTLEVNKFVKSVSRDRIHEGAAAAKRLHQTSWGG